MHLLEYLFYGHFTLRREVRKESKRKKAQHLLGFEPSEAGKRSNGCQIAALLKNTILCLLSLFHAVDVITLFYL